MTGHHHLRPDQTSRAFADRRERLRKDLVEHLGDRLAELRLDATTAIRATQFVVETLALRGITRRALLLLQACNFGLELVRALVDVRAELRRLPAEFRLGNSLQSCVVLVDLVDDRLNASPLGVVAGPQGIARARL